MNPLVSAAGGSLARRSAPVPRQAGAAALAIALLTALSPLAAVSASASHVTVRADGTGDYPTLNDAVQAMIQGNGADTLMVGPGYYDETVNIGETFYRVIYAPAGPESTRVREFTSLPEQPGYSGYARGRAVGLQIETCVAWGDNTDMIAWEGCVFAKGYHGRAPLAGPAPIHRCTFRDTSSFVGFGYEMSDCTFEGAPIYVENLIGYFALQRCTFRGPARQLAQVTPRDNSNIVFEDCSFSNAGHAVVVSPRQYTRQFLDLVRCRFDSLTGSVIDHRFGDWTVPLSGELNLSIRNSRITDVGQVVHCYTGVVLNLGLSEDTITTTRGIAVESVVRNAGVGGLRLQDARGGGMRLTIQNVKASRYWGGDLPIIRITDSRITESGGDGLTFVPLASPISDPQDVQVRNTVVERSAGAGITFTGSSPTVIGCLVRENSGDGLHAIAVGPAPACSLSFNTVVGNAGRGLTLESPSSVAPLSVHHNLVTGNGGDGLSVLTTYAGSVSRNDSWGNGGAAYAGPMSVADNLQLDPLYCMASAGDFELRADSPCAPSGVYGTIGAYGVGCALPAAVEPAAAPAALRVSPNPARGPVSFAWGGGARLTELAVFDVQGRRRWQAPWGSLASGTLRWEGRGAAGERLPAGVYLVRWRTDARSGSARLVLLGE